MLICNDLLLVHLLFPVSVQSAEICLQREAQRYARSILLRVIIPLRFIRRLALPSNALSQAIFVLQVVEIEFTSRNDMLNLFELALDSYFALEILRQVQLSKVVEVFDELVDCESHLSKLRLVTADALFDLQQFFHACRLIVKFIYFEL